MASEYLSKQFVDKLLRGSPESVAAPDVERLRDVVASDNVVGVGIAKKKRDGQNSDEVAVTFYVKEKRSERDIPVAERIPTSVRLNTSSRSPVWTDVVETGVFTPDRVNAVLQSGVSVGDLRGATGTLGALVKSGGHVGILSNQHVLASSGNPKMGSPILAPGKDDGGRAGKDAVGTLTRVVPFRLNAGHTNLMDAAFATVDKDDLARISPEILGLGYPKGIKRARLGMQVTKAGRTTGVTTGKVTGIHFALVVEYDGIGSVEFSDQVVCSRYSRPGDSGSLVLAEDDHKALGLHFASSADGESVFSPIGPILAALDLELLAKPLQVAKRASSAARSVRVAERARAQEAATLREFGAHAVGVRQSEDGSPRVVAYFDEMPEGDVPANVVVNQRGHDTLVPIDVEVHGRFRAE